MDVSGRKSEVYVVRLLMGHGVVKKLPYSKRFAVTDLVYYKEV